MNKFSYTIQKFRNLVFSGKNSATKAFPNASRLIGIHIWSIINLNFL